MEERYSTKSLISRFDKTDPMAGMAEGKFSLLFILEIGTLNGSAAEVFNKSSSAFSLIKTPLTSCPSAKTRDTIPNPGAIRALGSIKDWRICSRVSDLPISFKLEAVVARENKAKLIASGLGDPNNLYVRFNQG